MQKNNLGLERLQQPSLHMLDPEGKAVPFCGCYLSIIDGKGFMERTSNMTLTKTPLEAWISRKINGASNVALSREDIERYQIEKLNEMISRVKVQSRFYRQRLSGVKAGGIKRIEDIYALPFTTFMDLSADPTAFACVTQPEISRIMTVSTSGTSGNPKRVFFTQDDQEATTDFFQHGMENLAQKGDRVLILFPGEVPGSVGDILQKALERMGAVGIVHGSSVEPDRTFSIIEGQNINVLAGTPVQILRLARYQSESRHSPADIKSILLSADYVPGAIVDVLRKTWNCSVFNHYGATEMGLGGGVQCQALRGCHMREADLLFEIVDMQTGKPVKEGEYGEIVFTSLTACGTPLLRYRTGDISRFIPEPCPCGTVLKTMDIVVGRTLGRIKLDETCFIEMRDFDEALFRVEGLLDFQVTLTREGGKECLNVDVNLMPSAHAAGLSEIYDMLSTIPGVKSAENTGRLITRARVVSENFRRGTAKRIIYDQRS